MQIERNRSVTSTNTAIVASADRRPKFLINSKLDFKFEAIKTSTLKSQTRLKEGSSCTPKNEALNLYMASNLQHLNTDIKKKRKELILKLRLSKYKKQSALQTFDDCQTPKLMQRNSNSTTDTGSQSSSLKLKNIDPELKKQTTILRKPKLLVRQKTQDYNKENDKYNENFARKQRLALLLKMIVKQQKLNMDEIYECCIRKPFSEEILLAVMKLCKVMSTLGFTSEVKRGLQLCQRAIQNDQEISNLQVFMNEIQNSENKQLHEILNISSDSFEKTLNQIKDLKCSPSGLEVAKIQKIQIKKVSSQVLSSVDRSEQRTEQILKQAKNKYYLKREHIINFKKVENLLPQKNSEKEYTLVLDLDETLVHFIAKEKKFKLRPGCIQFLKDMSQLYEIVIFTAAAQDYADFILNYIDRDTKKYINHRLYRPHCSYDEGVYVKDLSKLGRDIKKTIIVDNIRDNFERQKDNGIEILTWLSDPEDRELFKLGTFLTKLAHEKVTDVRDQIRLYTKEKWRSLSPSKRQFRKLAQSSPVKAMRENKSSASLAQAAEFSPMKRNRGIERYSGTPVLTDKLQFQSSVLSTPKDTASTSSIKPSMVKSQSVSSNGSQYNSNQIAFKQLQLSHIKKRGLDIENEGLYLKKQSESEHVKQLR